MCSVRIVMVMFVVRRNYMRERDQIVHKYNGETQWTLCGRYADTLEGLMNVVATDKKHEVNCKRCVRIMGGRDE